MKALILVGGYGTRLRPLTLSVPKPLIHFCNKPIIEYQIQALAQVGVKHVILAVAYRPDAMKEALTELENKYGVKMSCSVEEEPLLTAGPIRLAKDLLLKHGEDEEDSDLFFVMNSDVICDYPMKDVIKFHKSHGNEGTILVTQVKNPSAFGVVIHNENSGKIEAFMEKPQQFVGDWINAGMYLLNTSVIDRIEPRPTSIETEVFPAMARDQQLYCYRLSSYWADIGQPKDYLNGCRLYLDAMSRQSKENICNNSLPSPQSTLTIATLADSPPDIEDQKSAASKLASGPNIIGNVMIDATATIGEGCVIGPDVTIGQGCTIGNGCRIKRSCILANVQIDGSLYIDNAIIGWNCRLGRWVRIEGLTVLGQDVEVKSECFVNAAFVLPNKVLKESVMEPGKIIM